MQKLADVEEIKNLRDQNLKNHPVFHAQNLLTGFMVQQL